MKMPPDGGAAATRNEDGGGAADWRLAAEVPTATNRLKVVLNDPNIENS